MERLESDQPQPVDNAVLNICYTMGKIAGSMGSISGNPFQRGTSAYKSYNNGYNVGVKEYPIAIDYIDPNTLIMEHTRWP